MTLLLRMARAHYEEQTRVPLNGTTSWAKWDDLPESFVSEKLACMRAALGVAREPTDGMIVDGAHEIFDPKRGGDPLPPMRLADAYAAMIDSLLSEKP